MITLKTKKKSNDRNYFAEFMVNAVKKVCYTDERRIADLALEKFIKASPTEDIANGWSYEIRRTLKTTSLIFNNSAIQNGTNMAVVIDVGHVSKSGTWVEGSHYLDKATKEAYDIIIQETWEALKNERN